MMRKNWIFRALFAGALGFSAAAVNAQEPSPGSANLPAFPSINLNEPIAAPFDRDVFDGGTANKEKAYWFTGDALLWWVSQQNVPPLVTTSTSQSSLGVIGQPDTSVLYGGNIGGYMTPGARFALGKDFSTGREYAPCFAGVEAIGFFLCNNVDPYSAYSNGSPVLARPFVNALNGQQFSEQVANQQVGTIPPGPGPRPDFARAFTGGVAVDNHSSFWGTEINGLIGGAHGLSDGPGWLRGLAGVRYFGTNESLRVGENLLLPAVVSGGNVLAPQTAINIYDRFQTTNNFVGPQLGYKTGITRGALSLEMTGKLAMGWMCQSVNITGGTTTKAQGGAAESFSGGLLAQPTNIGNYERTVFCVLPEILLSAEYQITQVVSLSVGYNFIYLSNVVRPGNQIDPQVDPRFRAGTTPPTDAVHPAFAFRDTDLWLQGINLGLAMRW